MGYHGLFTTGYFSMGYFSWVISHGLSWVVMLSQVLRLKVKLPFCLLGASCHDFLKWPARSIKVDFCQTAWADERP